jgi:pyruvate/2-oxoglutarate dehydrogenase complex dihydrolipoamide acyltransferase (E2) component
MPTQVLMPALSPTMEEGKLSKWVAKEGDAIKAGDVLAEIETDKATMEVEAVDEGRLGKILIGEGTEGVKVNTPIAVILGEGEEATDAPANGANGGASTANAPLEARGEPGPVTASSPEAGTALKDGEAEGRTGAKGPNGHISVLASMPTAHPAEDSPEVPEGTENGRHDRARGLARCHGGRDAPRRRRVHHGRGSRRISGRLQRSRRDCWTSSAAGA